MKSRKTKEQFISDMQTIELECRSIANEVCSRNRKSTKSTPAYRTGFLLFSRFMFLLGYCSTCTLLFIALVSLGILLFVFSFTIRVLLRSMMLQSFFRFVSFFCGFSFPVPIFLGENSFLFAYVSCVLYM